MQNSFKKILLEINNDYVKATLFVVTTHDWDILFTKKFSLKIDLINQKYFITTNWMEKLKKELKMIDISWDDVSYSLFLNLPFLNINKHILKFDVLTEDINKDDIRDNFILKQRKINSEEKLISLRSFYLPSINDEKISFFTVENINSLFYKELDLSFQEIGLSMKSKADSTPKVNLISTTRLIKNALKKYLSSTPAMVSITIEDEFSVITMFESEKLIWSKKIKIGINEIYNYISKELFISYESSIKLLSNYYVDEKTEHIYVCDLNQMQRINYENVLDSQDFLKSSKLNYLVKESLNALFKNILSELELDEDDWNNYKFLISGRILKMHNEINKFLLSEFKILNSEMWNFNDKVAFQKYDSFYTLGYALHLFENQMSIENTDSMEVRRKVNIIQRTTKRFFNRKIIYN